MSFFQTPNKLQWQVTRAQKSNLNLPFFVPAYAMLEGLFLQGCLKAIIQIYKPVVMYKKHLSQQCQKKVQFKADNIRTYGFAYVFYHCLRTHLYTPNINEYPPLKRTISKGKSVSNHCFFRMYVSFPGSTININ